MGGALGGSCGGGGGCGSPGGCSVVGGAEAGLFDGCWGITTKTLRFFWETYLREGKKTAVKQMLLYFDAERQFLRERVSRLNWDGLGIVCTLHKYLSTIIAVSIHRLVLHRFP